MMKTHTVRLWDAALLTLSPGCLIDRFLDWIEDMTAVMMPVHVKVPAETRRGPFGG